MRIDRRLACALLTVTIALACSGDSGTNPNDPNTDDGGGGGSGGGGGGDGGGNPAAVTRADTVWVEDMQTLTEQVGQWAGESADTIAARALAYLDDLPSVVGAGITPGTNTVWATFENGFNLVIPNNRAPSGAADTLPDDPAAPAPPLGRTGPARRVSAAGAGELPALAPPETAREIPTSAQFRAVNAIGTCHVNPLPGIRTLLSAGDYVDANAPLPTVAGLKNASGDGVFYINTHGGAGFDANQQAYYAIWTLDRIETATLPNYRAMLASHELVGMLETSNDAQGNCGPVMHYGITAAFVSRYMSFEKNSLVIVDACFSASAPAAGLRQAFADAGASTYVGWTGSVQAGFAYKAMKYLLDRLLGTNMISPESPKQRAFNIDDVRGDMANNRNLVVDPFQNAVLSVFPLQDDFGLLTPSIQFLSIQQSPFIEDELVIAGIFGTDPGAGQRAVTINGEPLDVVEWAPTLITASLPNDAAGTVVVEIGQGAAPRRSNPVNLTLWKGELIYEHDDPGDLRAEMRLKVDFRADIHSFRDEPHEQPFETTVLYGAMRTASVSITSGGSYSETVGICLNTWTLTKGAELASPFGPTKPEGAWNYLGSVDTQHRKLQLNLYALALYEAGTWMYSGPAECGPFTVPLSIALQPEDCLFDSVDALKAIEIDMGPDYDVLAGSRGPCGVDGMVGPLIDLPAQASMHWSAFAPMYPPDPDAPR